MTSAGPAAAPLPADVDRSRRRALAACGAMFATAGLAWLMRPVADAQGSMQVKLDELVPRRFGAWRSDSNVEALVRPPTVGGKAYGLYDQVLERVYVDASGASIMLSIVYGAEQSPGMQAHRPEVCYPAAGYVVERLQRGELALPGGSVPVTQLHARLGPRSEPITYWVVLGKEIVRDALAFRLRQIGSGLRRRILDGVLVRVSSLDEDAPRAWRAQQAFAGDMQAALDSALRPYLFGASGQPPA